MPPNQGLRASVPFVFQTGDERKSTHTSPQGPVARRRILSGGFRSPQRAGLSYLISNADYNDGYTAVRRTFVPSNSSSENVPQNEKKQNKTNQGYTLFHKVFRPELLDSEEAGAPIVVLHGGPSIPSDYLYPMVDCILSNRSIVFLIS
mmetsp:Transcript_4818/g.6356  ORF Transcript_4818/g.6356 Transcript_4818/m.6356 type:complete len:148 (+) Transcript_4818:135-578(+)